MIPANIIARKRDGQELTSDEIAEFVDLYTAGEIPDYQMAALAMAICIRGMTLAETTALTQHKLDSGQRLTWNDNVPKVDKHSTGGLGDKVSLILAPLLASCGLHVPMISGRGLGITGGTLDKLEAIEGFRTALTIDEIRQQTERVGCVICGANSHLAPADRKLYLLRDVTATIESVPLITASILSKKLAESLNRLVLDVKFGSGTFMADSQAARYLAQNLVRVGERLGVKTTALLSDMNQPLGRMVGNALEVQESMQVLRGEGPPEVRELVVALGGELMGDRDSTTDPDSAMKLLNQQLQNGAAYDKFVEMVNAQGGNLNKQFCSYPPRTLCTTTAGWVSHFDGRELGHALILLGAGRKVISDRIDAAAGFEVLVKIGDEVEVGQPVIRVFGRSDAVDAVSDSVLKAITISPNQIVGAPPLIVERLTLDDC
ncbi:MAG: thymidine phosphorylase [Planctomycetaceae bacterium]|nr:thymidine phosphorylase [Planctomycetaceae bacterium]